MELTQNAKENPTHPFALDGLDLDLDFAPRVRQVEFVASTSRGRGNAALETSMRVNGHGQIPDFPFALARVLFRP